MGLHARIATLVHGPVLFTTYDGSPMARAVHKDGHERLYKKEPLAERYPCVRCQVKSNEKSGRLCYRCAGDDRLTDCQRAYLSEVEALGLRQFPHCDSLILHSAEACAHCASPDYDALVGLRYKHEIAFTDQARPAWLGIDACPSTAYRSEKKRDRWPGNRAAS